MTYPTTDDVYAYLGGQPPHTAADPAGVDAQAQCQAHLDGATQAVKAYVRDRGFSAAGPSIDLAGVIVSVAARSMGNPTALQSEAHGIDDATRTTRYGVYNGWTLAELAILHRYRRRAL